MSLTSGTRIMSRPIALDIGDTLIRLIPTLHPLLDEPSLALPRARTLVWPAEAPPVPPEIAAVFTEVRVESGLPTSSGT